MHIGQLLDVYYMLGILILQQEVRSYHSWYEANERTIERTSKFFSHQIMCPMHSFHFATFFIRFCFILFLLLLLPLLYSFQFQLSLHVPQTLKRQTRNFYADASINGRFLSLSFFWHICADYVRISS